MSIGKPAIFAAFVFFSHVLCTAQPVCNNSVALCNRRYNEVVYLATHLSTSASAYRFVPPTQVGDIKTQLHDGVRALTLELHPYKHGLYFCHNDCRFGSLAAFEGFYDIYEFLRDHPFDILTLILDGPADANTVQNALAESGLLAFLHTQRVDKQWPTLLAMTQAKTQLVVFSVKNFGSAFPGFHYLTDFVWETPSCTNPVSNAPLTLLQHYPAMPILKLADYMNLDSVLNEKAHQCQNATKHAPNFIAVDFYSVGNAVKVVLDLNGFSP